MGTTFDIVAKREYHRCCLVDGALITGDDGTITTIACPGSFRFYKNYVNIPMYLILLEKKTLCATHGSHDFFSIGPRNS